MSTIKEYIQSSGMTADELFDDLNGKTERVYVEINTTGIKRYLIMVDKWIGLQKTTGHSDEHIAALANTVMDTLNNFETLHYANDMVRAKVDAMLDALVTITILSQTEADYVKSMGTKSVSKVSLYGLNRIDTETIAGIING